MIDLKPLPMREAIEFWRSKVKLGPREFNALAAEAKLRAFAVNGIAKGDELATVYGSLSRALEEGISFADFKRDCRGIFEKRGWSGRRAWRVDNIFRTNIQTAYNVGRYKQLQAARATRPYWMYDAVNDRRTRPTHRALNGKVFPADHPFWENWYPPNGFRCRCGVTSLSARQVEARGLTVESEDPTHTYIHPINAVTGQPDPVPVQLLPDPGFAYHPGKSYWGGFAASGEALAAGELKQMPGLLGHDAYRLPAARNLKRLPPLPELLPSLAKLKADGMSNKQAADYYRGEFRKLFGLAADREKMVSVAGEPVLVSERFVVGKGGRFKATKGERGQYIPLFHRTVTDPDEIWLTPMKNEAGQVVLRRRQLAFWRDERDPANPDSLAGYSVLDVDRGVATGVTIYDVAGKELDKDGRLKLDDPVVGYRRGVLLYRKK